MTTSYNQNLEEEKKERNIIFKMIFYLYLHNLRVLIVVKSILILHIFCLQRNTFQIQTYFIIFLNQLFVKIVTIDEP